MVESIVEITKKKARNGSRKIETECPVSKENGIRRIEKKSMIIIENDTTTQAQISNIVKLYFFGTGVILYHLIIMSMHSGSLLA